MKTMMKTLIFSFLMISVISLSAGNGDKNSKAISKDVNKNFLSLNGECLKYRGKLKNVTVRVFQENELIDVLLTEKKGKFSLILEKNRQYTLEFIKEGFLTKRMIFFTEAPEEVNSRQSFDFSVELLEESKFKEVNPDVLDFPAALIQFNPKKNEFEYDKKYTKEIIIEQELLMYKSYMKQFISLN